MPNKFTNKQPVDSRPPGDKTDGYRFTRRQKALLAALAVAMAALYFLLNQPDSHAVVLSGPLDAALPIVPALALPYIVFLPVFGVAFAYAFFKDRGFVRLALAVIIVAACSNLMYLLVQTHVPRPQVVGHGLFDQLLSYIYSHDQPFSDFPSEHAAYATVLALYCWSLRTKYWQAMVGLCVSVIFATFLIKQHSLLGACCGVVLGLVAWQSAKVAQP